VANGLTLCFNARLSRSINPYLTELKSLLEAIKKSRCNVPRIKPWSLNALDVQIVAIPQEMKIRIAVPLEFITIEQTSA
jgi:hypothetical protein